MKSSMRHSRSLKNKNTVEINILEDKLFQQLQTVEPTQPKYQDLQFKYLSANNNPVNDLIYRARGITNQNQDKIEKAKRQIKVSKKDGVGTFLTGTGLYTDDQEQQRQVREEPEPELDHDEMLKDLVQKNSYDDLEELRRMIRETSENLNGYSRQIHKTKKDVMSAANQFHTQMDYTLTCNLNRLQAPNRKTSSVARFKDNRYK